MRAKKTDPELPVLLPFEPGIVSNGEFVPPEPSAALLSHVGAAIWPPAPRAYVVPES